MSAIKTSTSALTAEQNIQQLLHHLGEDPNREGLQQTPLRYRKALEFLTQGYTQSLPDIINGALFESTVNQIILVQDIEIYSLCEHHLLPFIGKCHVAYLPNGKVLGLSKVARIVEMFARRLQIQENLTQQIAECMQQVTAAKGVAVIIEAQHLCMQMRGVQKQNSTMKTSVMLGLLRDNDKTRNELLSLLK